MIWRHSKLMFSVAVSLFAVPLWVYSSSPSPQGMDGVLRDMGYNAVYPPSTLVGLGSLYNVSSDGRNYTTVCEVDPALLVGRTKQSRSTQYTAQQLQDVNYAWGARLASLVSTKLSSDVLESVNLSLSDVTVFEVPLAWNEEIFIKLTEDPNCDAAVHRLLENNEFVCQGKGVLAATVEYGVNIKSGVQDATEAKREAISAVKSTVEADTNVQIVQKDEKLETGTALNYGVKLNPTCVTPPTARHGRYLPRGWVDRFVNFVRDDVTG
jgi:hypothetical protein